MSGSEATADEHFEDRRHRSSFTKLAWWVMGSLASIVTLGGTAWVTTTNQRLTHLEESSASIGREVSELKAGQRSMEEMQRQIISSLREVRDDVKILLRAK